jgi:hypothetical protein
MQICMLMVRRNESLSLHGGLSKNGQPAQLVKNGKLVSLRTGEEMDPESSMEQRLRRSVSIELDHDIERSMARRRKAEQAAMKEHQKCKECDKVFRRPCDLT